METLLEAYFDESGAHSDARVFVVSGYLAPAEKWEKFAYEWANMLSEANLTHWHQVDFAQRVREYSGWTEENRVKFMQRAVGIIKNTVNAGVSCGVNAMAFKELAIRLPLRPYAFCAMGCFKHLERWASDNSHRDPIVCVFESGAPGRGEVSNMVQELMSAEDGERLSFRISFRFETKKQFLPLQAADILAYECYKEALSGHIRGEVRGPRKSLVELGPTLFGGTFHTRAMLEEFIAKIANEP
jgi:Protein of unknown function (DUF3800)